MKPKYLGALAVIISAALWAVDGIVLRPALYSLDVMTLVFAEHALALLLMSFFVIPHLQNLKELNWKEWTVLFFIGLFGGVLGTYAITKAIFLVYAQGASISVVLLLQKLQPVFAIALAALLLRERPTKKYFAWAFLALIGSYLLTFGFSIPQFSTSTPEIQAALLALLAAISWGSSTTLGKYALRKLTFVEGTYIRFAMTATISFIFLLFGRKVFSLGGIGGNQWLLLLLIAFTTGAGAIFLYYWGLQKIKASSATIYELAFPVTALVADYFINKQLITWQQGIGAIILICSILFLMREKNPYRHITGTIASGKKEGAGYVKLYRNVFKKTLGVQPYLGTLNVVVKKPIHPRILATIPGFTSKGKHYGAVDYTPARINGHSCYILLPKKSTHENTLELLADVNLRKKLALEDGSSVTIEY